MFMLNISKTTTFRNFSQQVLWRSCSRIEKWY